MMEKLRPTLVLGGTGKTGRRVVERLRARRLPVRVGSRALGREPRDFAQYARDAAATGVFIPDRHAVA